MSINRKAKERVSFGKPSEGLTFSFCLPALFQEPTYLSVYYAQRKTKFQIKSFQAARV